MANTQSFSLRRNFLFLFASLFLFISLTQCKKTVKDEAYYESISQYIMAYTSGSISSTDAIQIRFANPIATEDMVGTAVGKALNIKPNIEGEALWKDPQTIVLQPIKPLPFGQKYTAALQLNSFFKDIPAELKVFDFSFMVRDLGLDVQVLGLQNVAGKANIQTLEGSLDLSELLENVAVENMLTATQDGKTLPITWMHYKDSKSHGFSVNNVVRAKNASEISLNWSASAIGAKSQGKKKIEIPAIGVFKVLQVHQDTDNGSLRINFSDALQTSQNLQGLVQIEGYGGNMRTSINGNDLLVFPDERLEGDFNLMVHGAIRNSNAQQLDKMNTFPLSFAPLKPRIRLVGTGNIIPHNTKGDVLFPFEAVGLKAVDVEIFKIYNSNILQFLQTNNLDGSDNLEQVGKIILQKKINLNELNPTANTKVWNRYAIDLKPLIEKDPGAIYRVNLVFRRSYTTQACASSEFDDQNDLQELGAADEFGNKTSLMGSYYGIYPFKEGYRYYNGDEEEEEETEKAGELNYFNWDNRANPCKKEYYYTENFTQRTVFVSDLGVMAKMGKDRSMLLLATDLRTALGAGKVNFTLYNYQLQEILTVTTDKNGTALIENLPDKPFIAMAHRGSERGYVRLPEGGSLSLSRFDVSGVDSQKGLKGFLYGDRGVWRPGDSIYLNFVLENKNIKVPTSHPVITEVRDSRGTLRHKAVQTVGEHGVYPLHFATAADAPTGTWQAKVMVGGATFSQSLKVETVKPNRLKMEVDFGDDKNGVATYSSKNEGKIQVKFLHGAVGADLPLKVDLQVEAAKTEFKGYKGFVFDDPTRRASSESALIFDGKTDANGVAKIPLNFQNNNGAPGKLNAKFRIRAFERSGDFSTDNYALEVSPYDFYTGILIPTDNWGNKTVDKAEGATVSFAVVDKSGKALANRTINIGLYRMDWSWWWDADANQSYGRYNTTNHANALESKTLQTDSKGMATWKIKPTQWGRYMVRVIDPVGGHSSGDFFWMGYPDSNNGIEDRQAAAMLQFKTNKENYATGETVSLTIPASAEGRIFVSLENGERVIDHFWENAAAGDNTISFKADESMAPTLYAHVMLLQPHGTTENDLPIRLYGVIPIKVENPKTRLEPQIAMPDVLKPDQPFTVSVSEKTGHGCAYTLAIVDDGLLDLTRFKTPDPWTAFNAREGLGVQTWDVYDYVLGAFGGTLERILGIGGDAFNQKSKNDAQISRFKPVVKHIGPFYLKPGQTVKHTLQIDNYVGSVRAMLVCSAPEGQMPAYGMAEKTAPVRQALMVLPTLPRVLGPGETFRMPVNVFAMENKVKNAQVSVSSSSKLVSVLNGAQNLAFSQPSDKMAYFDIKVGNKTGPVQFKINASGAGEQASQTIDIEVRNPNPIVSSILEGIPEKGQAWKAALADFNMPDIEQLELEVSAIKPINLSRHLGYLLKYPYGCVEQTTSAAFPQLYVDIIAPLSEKQRKKVDKNIQAAISKLSNFQTTDGGFAYWPGGGSADEWASNYVGHFLSEAKKKGYAVPENMLNRWLTFNKTKARNWSTVSDVQNNPYYRYDREYTQAYRLYALANAGQADLANMNRLKESKDLYGTSAQLLAAAYALAGQNEVASKLINSSTKKTFEYIWWGGTYGSTLRDRAFELESYTAMGDLKKANAQMEKIVEVLGQNDRWFSTQELGNCLRAIAKYAEKSSNNQDIVFTYKIGNQSDKIKSKSLISRIELDPSQAGQTVTVTNNGGGKLYTRLIAQGREALGSESKIEKNISLFVRYRDAKSGEVIEVNQIKQGTDFFAEVHVERGSNSSLNFPFNELALAQIFPSGWEITSTRLSSIKLEGNSSSDYQDYRDDRVFTFFDLPRQYQKDKKEVVTYRVELNAAYPGRYYLPPVSCEAMYDDRILARTLGQWVEVI